MEACSLYPKYSRTTWSGKFDAYCQQIGAWKIRSCGLDFFISSPFEAVMASSFLP